MRQHANGVLFEGTPVDFFFETLCSVFMKNMIDVFGMSRHENNLLPLPLIFWITSLNFISKSTISAMQF